MSTINSEVVLGYQLNLIKGIKPEWDTLRGKGSPFFAPDRPNQLKIKDLPPIDPGKSSFNKLDIYFLYSWKELVDALFNGWRISDKELENNPSPFVLVQPSGEEIRRELCKKLGIKLEDASDDGKTGFALVRITKIAVKAAYDSLGPELMKEELPAAFGRLSKVAVDAAPFLEFFGKYGTHFVSEIEVGDSLYQVFVYDEDQLRGIEKRYGKNHITDLEAVSFQQYTERKSASGGHSRYVGTLNLASNDPAFEGMRSQFRDDANWIECSIFVAIQKEKEGLLAQLCTVIPIGCLLTNLSVLIEDEARREVYSYVFRNALYQKYGANINPAFPPFTPPYDYAGIYEAFRPPFVSTISTAKIGIYQVHLHLEEVVTLNPDNVKKTFIFSDVIEVQKDVELPGEDLTIICRKFISHTQKTRAPVIRLSEDGYESFKFYCQEFDGVAEVRKAKTGEHKLISRGQALKTVTTGGEETTVIFEMSHTVDPPISLLRGGGDKTLYTLGFPLHSAECIINYPASPDALAVATLFVKWLVDMLRSATEEDPDLLSIRAQALLLLKSTKSLAGGVLTVPYLTYDAYKPTIDAMMAAVDAFDEKLQATTQLIQIRKSQEIQYKNLDELNRNLQSMGRFLIEQNRALAEKEKDVVNYHDQVDQKQQAMLKDGGKKVDDLKKKLEVQQKVMDEAGPKLEAAVSAYITEQELQAFIQLAGAVGSLFAGGAGIAFIRASELEGIERLMKKIDAAMKLIDGISKLYSAVDLTVQTAIAASNALSKLPDETDFPSALEWTEFDAEVYAAVGPITSKVPYANTYLKEAKILSARGRAYIDAASQVSRLQYEMMLNGWQKEVSKRQSERLKDLGNILSQPDLTALDAERIDLFELGSIYQSHAQRLILKLVKTLALQDSALQYYYLQPPSPIRSYDLPSLKEVVVSQAENSISALESFPSKPSDLKEAFVWPLRGLKVSQLLDDGKSPSDRRIGRDEYANYSKGGHDFEIPLEVEDIFNYVRVRIREIEMEITGIKSTNSGKVALRLETSAHPFYDRGLDREEIAFNAICQEFEYVYNLKTKECTYTNRPSGEFAQYFMKMTPFTRWRVSLPMGPHSENLGIEFYGDQVDIALRFHLEAIRFSPRELTALKLS